MNFGLLDARSEYSLLQAVPKIPDLVRAAKQRGFSAVALTDGPGLYGAIEFYKACAAAELKPLIGLSIDVCLDASDERNPHMLSVTGIAANDDGYRELVYLSSRAMTRQPGMMPGWDKQYVTKEEWTPGTNVIWALAMENFEKARQYGDDALRETIAAETKGGRRMALALDARSPAARDALKFAATAGLTPVAMPRAAYLNGAQREAYRVVKAINRKCQVADLPEERDDYAMLSAEEMQSAYADAPEALAAMESLVAECSWTMELNKWSFPNWPLAEGETYDGLLRAAAYEGAEKKFGALSEEYRERMEKELGIIGQKGYSAYFLIVADLINWAKEHEVATTTRGSAAGSLVSHCIGIIDVNPMEYNLPFERFLNPFRPSLPDIDMDFADYRRHEVLEYAKRKYGEDHVAQIGTFGTMQPRAVVRDVGRALGYSYAFCDGLAKAVPMGKQGFPMTLDRALEESPSLLEQYQTNPDAERLVELGKILEGNVRHCSVHAAGVVISPQALMSYVPLLADPDNGQTVTQFDMTAVEEAGLVKMDFLGIRNLTVIEKAVKMIRERHGVSIDISNLPLDNALTFEKISRGETSGLFQLNGMGMTRYLKELKPTSIHDLMAMVALYRPGPIDSIPEYIRRKNGEAPIDPPHPLLGNALDKSFGLLVYQDDVLLTAINLAGYDWGEADKFRKAMGKKIPEEMAKQKIKFYDGCKNKNGLTEKEIDKLWTLIEPFAAYGFNKAHACSYGMVAYQTAYLKANYPVEYMAAVLNSEIGDLEQTAEAANECRRLGIAVLPPCANRSGALFRIETKPGEAAQKIRVGLLAVKNVGEHAVAEIERVRDEVLKRPFADLSEFLLEVKAKDLNKKSFESLVMVGALSTPDAPWGRPTFLLEQMESLLSWRKACLESEQAGQSGLFQSVERPSAPLPKDAFAGDASADDEARGSWERNLLGFYAGTHPLSAYLSSLSARRKTMADALALGAEQTVVIAVRVGACKVIRTKKDNKAMLAVAMIDESGEYDAILFPKTYDEQGRLWQKAMANGTALLAEATVSDRNGELGFIIQKTKALVPGENTNANTENKIQNKEEHGAAITLRIERQLDPSEFEQLKKTLRAHPGNAAVRLEFVAQRRILETAERVAVNDELRQLLRRNFGITIMNS